MGQNAVGMKMVGIVVLKKVAKQIALKDSHSFVQNQMPAVMEKNFVVVQLKRDVRVKTQDL